MIRFTEFVDKYKYLPNTQSQLTGYFSKIFAYVCDHYDGTKIFKRKTIKCINVLSYLVVQHEDFWDLWDDSNMLNCLPDVSDTILKQRLQGSYLVVSDIKWDIDIVDDSDLNDKISLDSDINITSDNSISVDESQSYTTHELSDYIDTVSSSVSIESGTNSELPTPPDDLYLEGPIIPQIDVNRIWKQGVLDGRRYTIYTSLPDIPTKQCEISLTTNPDYLTDTELLRLYPNRRLYTRSQTLYDRLDRVDFDTFLGIVLHVDGFTRKQMIDNIIKYPHFENIVREGRVKGNIKYVDFWKYIEIDGELYKTRDIWDTLDDTKRLPKVRAIMEDYVIRRYLLERDIKHIDHKYKMFGTLGPYLTLFMPQRTYVELGYSDVINIAKQCVKSRVSYKLSRNPILRRLNVNV